MRPSVAIIGSGAAAAFAYQACKDYGCSKIEIFTDRMGTPSPGAFYFHWLPKEFADRFTPDNVCYIGLGTATDYLAKQWPDMDLGEEELSSFPDNLQISLGWDSHDVWEALWSDANISLVAGRFSDTDLRDFGKYYNIVILTFPTQESKKEQGHFLVKIPICASTSPIVVGEGLHSLVKGHQHFIIYNGQPDIAWVRLSYLWGQLAYEFPFDSQVGAASGGVEYRYDMRPGTPKWHKLPAKNFGLVGRLAKWDRQYLSHHAFTDVYNLLLRWDEGYRDFSKEIEQ